MDYKGELRRIIRDSGMSGSDLSSEIGMSYDYFRASTQRKGLGSRIWVRCFVIGYRLGKKFNDSQAS